MRIENVLRNSFYAVVSYLVVGLLILYVRKLFVEYLPIELLGVESLFVDIVTILSVAEMGLSTIVSYGLYKELANKNETEINILMNIFKVMYCIIGIIIFMISIVIFFFLPKLITANNIPWIYIQIVYIVQIGTILSSYFLAYKRIILTCDQKDYICIKYDTICNCIVNIIRLIAIIFFKNYIFYIVIGLLFNIIANIIISKKVNKIYPFIHSIKITKEEIKKRRLFNDVKNFLIQRLSFILYMGIDSILITFCLGLNFSGLVANYTLIHSKIYALIFRLLQGIIPTVGNIIYSEDKERTYKIYKTLDMGYFLFAGYIACIYMVAFQSFVSLFFGKEFLLDDRYVIALAFNIFISMQFENAYNFRKTFGMFEQDRVYIIIAAFIKIVLSIICMKYFGIVGIVIGTIIGFIFIAYARIQFVFRIIFKSSMKKYLIQHIIISIMVIGCVLLVVSIIKYINFSIGYINLLLECLLSILLLTGLYGLIYIIFKFEEFKYVIYYVKRIFNIIFNKIK